MKPAIAMSAPVLITARVLMFASFPAAWFKS